MILSFISLNWFYTFFITSNKIKQTETEYKLLPWININKLSWRMLSKNPNPNALDLLEKNQDKINWHYTDQKEK